MNSVLEILERAHQKCARKFNHEDHASYIEMQIEISNHMREVASMIKSAICLTVAINSDVSYLRDCAMENGVPTVVKFYNGIIGHLVGNSSEKRTL